MDLYFSRMSGNSARVVFTMFESGAAWTPHVVDPRQGENKRAEYLAVNPMGKVPALKAGQLVLWESNAINWYVAETHPEASLLPGSPAERALVHRWLFFQTGHITPACVQIFRTTNTSVQEFWNTRGDARAAENARKELDRFLPVLEAALEGREWLEREFSLADIAYAPHFMMLKGGGFDFSPWPRLEQWLGRLWARPAWKRTQELMFG